MSDYILDGAKLVQYTGSDHTVCVPKAVTVIGAEAFKGCDTLVRLVVPDTVTAIKRDAFRECAALQSVRLGDNILTIGAAAFKGCKRLQQLTLPANLQDLADDAFDGCRSLGQITFPATMKQIGQGFWSHCPYLRRIAFREGTEEVEYGAFARAENIYKVTLPDSLRYLDTSFTHRTDSLHRRATRYVGADGRPVEYLLDGTTLRWTTDCSLEDLKMTAIGPFAIAAERGRPITLSIPASVTEIHPLAFWGCVVHNRSAIDLPNGHFRLENGLLLDDSDSPSDGYTHIVLPEGLSAMYAHFFRNHTAMQRLHIPASVTEIGEDAFADCPALAEVTVDPANPHYAVRGGVLYDKIDMRLILCPAACKNAVLPEGLRTIAFSAFPPESRLNSLTIPKGTPPLPGAFYWNCRKLQQVCNYSDTPFLHRCRTILDKLDPKAYPSYHVYEQKQYMYTSRARLYAGYLPYEPLDDDQLCHCFLSNADLYSPEEQAAYLQAIRRSNRAEALFSEYCDRQQQEGSISFQNHLTHLLAFGLVDVKRFEAKLQETTDPALRAILLDCLGRHSAPAGMDALEKLTLE